ncbi:fibronectin type III domain-containing protein [Anaerovoracaceae bacterium 42-11]
MKKFLTVLLALSVVFTYSFSAVGSVFAATPSDEVAAAKIEAGEIKAEALKKLSYADDKLTYIDSEKVNEVITKTAVEQAIADLQMDINKALDATLAETDVTTAIANVKTDYYADAATYLNKLFDYETDAYKYTKVLEKQFAIDKAEALAKVNAVKVTDYYKADQADVKADVETAKNAVTVAIDSEAVANAMEDFLADYKTKAVIDTELATAKTDKIKAINEAAAVFKTTEAENLKKEIENPATVSDKVALATARLAALDANVTAVANLLIAQVNAAKADSTEALATSKNEITAVDTALLTESAAFYEAVAKLGGVSFLKNYAATLAAAKKAELATDGTVKYYAATVDETLADVNTKIDNLKITTAGGIDAAFDAMVDRKTADGNLDKLRNNKKAEVDDLIASKSFDTERNAKVEKIVKDAKDAIDAATDEAAMDVIVATAEAKIEAILTTKQIEDLKGSVDTVYSASYASAIDAHVDSIIEKNGADKYTAGVQKAGIAKKVKEYFYDLVIAKEDATLSEAAVKSIMAQGYAGALAVAEKNLVANDTLTAAEKSINDQLAVLEYTVTAENAPKIMAVYDEYLRYSELNGHADAKINTVSKLNYLVKQVVLAEAKVITDKVDAIATKTIFTLDDVAALEALKKDAEAFNAKYANTPDFTEIADPVAANAAKIEAARFLDATAKINAIPDDLTYEDKAAVEAARAAYDALTAEQKKDLNPIFLAKLIAAETKLEALEKVEAERAIKAVESFKIKVTTKRYTGSKMRINWTATGDESAIDGYRIYYSTKKSNSGYKYLAKTTKKYINHTSIKKSVKKGTRVYYRVRAYVEIDGVRYFSDYSTVGNRIWK